MRRNLVISILLLPSLGFTLLSQGLPFFSSYSISDPRPSLFQVNGFSNESRGQYTLSIPFRFPAELELGRPANLPTAPSSYDPLAQIQIFSPVLPFGASQPYRNPEGTFDMTSRSANYSALSYQPNVTYISYRRGVSFDMGLSFGLSLNQGGLAYLDVSEARLRVKYTLNRNIFSFVKNSRWELFLQLSELHRFDGDNISRQFNTALKIQDPAKSNFVGRQIYVSPGISISSSNIVLEGMVKVPLNAREANKTLDDLWSPEVQGNLGLKYLFPVKATAN
ncbi:hypothetical protein EHQ58_04685 [Leptospira ognonensis]|uniref:Uncharacterized protein n=1 Tax=Leptospira ognonensis TaxID=2484945 RepID=A0A4R9K899_9LEPT|nr:hypothetical protein [Leptospira ognonensis]TGL61907.1 hypothetical protein EHQ58_04685 [Leptospira ognonensis]